MYKTTYRIILITGSFCLGEAGLTETDSRSVVVQGWGQEQGLTAKGDKRPFGVLETGLCDACTAVQIYFKK